MNVKEGSTRRGCGFEYVCAHALDSTWSHPGTLTLDPCVHNVLVWCVCACACVRVCVYVCVHVCMHACIHACICVYMFVLLMCPQYSVLLFLGTTLCL